MANTTHCPLRRRNAAIISGSVATGTPSSEYSYSHLSSRAAATHSTGDRVLQPRAKAQAGSLSAGSASEGVYAILDDGHKAPKPTIDGAVEVINLHATRKDRRGVRRWFARSLAHAALAEFQTLRGEIVQRIQLQQVFLGLAITALGALLSVALAGKTSRASLLLATPFATRALGFAYSDHARRINLLGEYIKDELWSHIRSLTDGRLSSWEERLVHQVSP